MSNTSMPQIGIRNLTSFQRLPRLLRASSKAAILLLLPLLLKLMISRKTDNQVKQGMEHVICDVIVRHYIIIVAAAILQLVSN